MCLLLLVFSPVMGIRLGRHWVFVMSAVSSVAACYGLSCFLTAVMVSQACYGLV